jgi:hypothetical protein
MGTADLELQHKLVKRSRLIVFPTRLDYYGLLVKVQVSISGGMTDIVETQLEAAQVITL